MNIKVKAESAALRSVGGKAGVRRPTLRAAGMRRVETWRGGVRPSMPVFVPFVRGCLSGL